jgi:hypothetical protein
VDGIGLYVDIAILGLHGNYDQVVDMIEISSDKPFSDIRVRVVDD